jgi:hypothetical protein
MIGASMTTRNIRRTGTPATIKGKPNPAYPSIEIHGSPTPERLRMAGNDFALGGEDRGIKTYTMRDSPLDRAHKKGIISGAEHSALQKYRHHWYHAGQAPTIGSLDLDRIFSGGEGGPAGMPKSEGQVFHRQRWREAQACLGMRSSAVVDRFVCQEENLELCGQAIGWANKPQAIAGAAELVKDAGYRLARLWGIG